MAGPDCDGFDIAGDQFAGIGEAARCHTQRVRAGAHALDDPAHLVRVGKLAFFGSKDAVANPAGDGQSCNKRGQGDHSDQKERTRRETLNTRYGLLLGALGIVRAFRSGESHLPNGFDGGSKQPLGLPLGIQALPDGRRHPGRTDQEFPHAGERFPRGFDRAPVRRAIQPREALNNRREAAADFIALMGNLGGHPIDGGRLRRCQKLPAERLNGSSSRLHFGRCRRD